MKKYRFMLVLLLSTAFCISSKTTDYTYKDYSNLKKGKYFTLTKTEARAFQATPSQDINKVSIDAKKWFGYQIARKINSHHKEVEKLHELQRVAGITKQQFRLPGGIRWSSNVHFIAHLFRSSGFSCHRNRWLNVENPKLN